MDAVERVIFHASGQPGSFLEMLRPFRGVQDDVVADLEMALRASVSLLAEERLRRDLVCALWSICYLGRSWAVEQDGMLVRNLLILEHDRKRLANFIGGVEYAVMMILDGADSAAAFELLQAK